MIDDDEDFTSAVATFLRDAKYEVQVELDIKSAEKSLTERRPDLIILDVMFPESSSAGFSLSRKINQIDPDGRDIPVLMLTAVNEKFPLGFTSSDIDDHWMPVNGFLEKPIDYDVLKNKVDSLIAENYQ